MNSTKITLQCDNTNTIRNQNIQISPELKNLLRFYLENVVCYPAGGEEIKSSRNIEITSSYITFFKRDENMKEISVEVPFEWVKEIAQYTPFVSYKHFDIIQKLITLYQKNRSSNGMPSVQNHSQSNISTELEGTDVANALYVIKSMTYMDQIKYTLLFVLYFFPLDVLSKNVERSFESLIRHTGNPIDYYKRLLLSYILSIYPTNPQKSNANVVYLFHKYNETLFEIKKEYALWKTMYIPESVENEMECAFHKFVSQEDTCKVERFELNEYQRTGRNYFILPESLFNLLAFVKSKSGERSVIVNMKRNPMGEIDLKASQIIVRDGNRSDVSFSYDFILRVSAYSTYLSFHQLYTLYQLLEERNQEQNFFEYALCMILFVYGNHEFKLHFPKIAFYDLPTKDGVISSTIKENMIYDVRKMMNYHQKMCESSLIRNVSIQELIQKYESFMKDPSSSQKRSEIQALISIWIKICKCGIVSEEIECISLPNSSCKVNKSTIQRTTQQMATVFKGLFRGGKSKRVKSKK